MLRTPAITVVMPARNEGARVGATIASLANACEEPSTVEVVVVDDCSEEETRPDLGSATSPVPVRVIRSDEHLGVGAARNLGVQQAHGDIVFITDAHVRFSVGWDIQIGHHIAPRRVLAATIQDPSGAWSGFGCHLVVPYMGTRWNAARPSTAPYVQVASSAGTILERSLFHEIGGYDEGMVHYSGFEPEFSVRAWLSGAEIVMAPDIKLAHRFKSPRERVTFTRAARTNMVHNCLRFGVVHLPESMILEMTRVHAVEFPDHIPDALRMLEERGAWERRRFLQTSLRHDFQWFVDRFSLRDQFGNEIPAR